MSTVPAVSLFEIAAARTYSPASSSRALVSRFSGVTGPRVTPTPPRGTTQGRVEQRSMTVVNLTSHVLRLVRIEGAVAADRLPPTGVLVRRGEQLAFDVAPCLDPEERVVACFEVADAAGPEGAHLYPVAVSPAQGGRSNRAVRMLPAAVGSPLTQIHLTQDHIVLRNSAD